MTDVKTLLRRVLSVACLVPPLIMCVTGVATAQEQPRCTLKGVGPEPKAVIQQIRVGNNNLPADQRATQVVIIPASGQGTVLGELGCALFPKDQLTTEPNVEVTLSFPVEAEGGEKEFVEVILVGKTKIEISSLTAYFGTFIVKAKSALQNLRGRFNVKTDRGALGINGTEYTLTIPVAENPARDATLLVTEGQVIFEPKSPPVPTQPTPAASPVTSDTGQAAVALATNSPPASDVINSGEKAVITGAGEVIKQELMTDEGGQLNRDSEVVFSALPTYTAQYILPSFDSHQQRLQAFTQARRSIFMKEGGSQGLAASYETLARVYCDLGSGKEALKALKNAKELYSGDDADDDDDTNDRQGSWSPSAQFLTLRGKAHLLTGDLKEAEKDLTEALQKSSSSFDQRWELEALGALIGVSLRETFEELKEKDNEGAERALNEAKSFAVRLEPLESRLQTLTPALRAALLTTIGEMSLRSGDLVLAKNEENRLQKAFEHYTQAEQWCSAAQKADENHAFALLCLGDANRDLGTVSRAASNAARQIDEAINFYNQAESKYQEAFRRHNYFAEAQASLRNLYAVRAEFNRGKSKQVLEEAADKSAELAIKLDPKAFLEEVEVPDVRGKTQAVAAKLVTEAGLVPEIEGVGLVYEQSLETGKKVKRGTSITIKAKFPPKFRLITKYVNLGVKG